MPAWRRPAQARAPCCSSWTSEGALSSRAVTVALHSIPGAASLVAHAVLLETGTPYRLVPVERDARGRATAEYLALNPTGRVPTVVDGDAILTEAAAICMHYADLHPAAGLAPEVGTAERAQWYRWHCSLTNTVQPAFLRFFYPERYTIDPAASDGVQEQAIGELDEWRARLDAQLSARPYLLGDACTTVDLFACMLTRWGRRLPTPWWSAPNLAAHFRRVADRPSMRRVWEIDELDRDGEPG